MSKKSSSNYNFQKGGKSILDVVKQKFHFKQKKKSIYLDNSYLDDENQFQCVLDQHQANNREFDQDEMKTLGNLGAADPKSYQIYTIDIEWEGQKSIMLIIEDISWNLQVTKLMEVNSYKDRILSHVTHDLKTPLTGIITICEGTMQS